MSPGFSRLLFNTKRLSINLGFLTDEMALSAKSGLCLLSEFVSTDYILQEFNPGSLNFFVAFCCGNKLVLGYCSEISIKGVQMSSACHRN
jgi:hypothetical protein